MSDIGKPRAPASGDDLIRPDAGFHDDKIGSELKHKEAAKRRAMQARTSVKPRRIEQEPKKVAAAGAFGKAAREEQPHVVEAKRHQRALVAGQPQPRGRAQNADARGDAERAAARVHTLFSAMVSLEGVLKEKAAGPTKSTKAKGFAKQVEAVDADRQQRQQTPDTPEPDELATEMPEKRLAVTAAERLARAHQQARFHVQHLVAGGTGFALGSEASATFAGLFSRLPVWPQGVPPGHTPVSETDFDQFFAWVFLPAELADLEWSGQTAG